MIPHGPGDRRGSFYQVSFQKVGYGSEVCENNPKNIIDPNGAFTLTFPENQGPASDISKDLKK